MQAVIAINDEYGWAVSYEDPPYESIYDLVEMGSPQWRAVHPGVPPGWIPSGGAFQSTYQEGPDISAESDDQERQILENIVADYNQSGNPGKFVVRKQSDGSYTIIGNSIRESETNDKSVNAALDTPISVTGQTVDGVIAVNTIMQAVYANSGVRIVAGDVLAHTLPPVMISGDNLPARVLLEQILNVLKFKTFWTLQYDPDAKRYGLIFSQVHRVQLDAFGNKTVVTVPAN
jgi:hypothetical protein